ncbi:hypothetical protein AcW1_004838 [Taiwanofungus camphoratus]|nr:hypothetical protein AcW1_004838 [Antrodia cinnamomea]
MADSSSSTAKIPLPAFLKILTSNNVPASKAMAVASKIYKTYNTPSLLGQLTDLQLKAAGVDDKEVRKLVLAALRKSGYKGKAAQASITTTSSAQSTPSAAGPSTPPGSSRAETQRPRKKRKRDDDLNEFFPDRPLDEGEMYGSLEFNEILDEEVLKTKFTVVNRAPIMMAWAFVVAERLGFQREEALSIGIAFQYAHSLDAVPYASPLIFVHQLACTRR